MTKRYVVLSIAKHGYNAKVQVVGYTDKLQQVGNLVASRCRWDYVDAYEVATGKVVMGGNIPEAVAV